MPAADGFASLVEISLAFANFHPQKIIVEVWDGLILLGCVKRFIRKWEVILAGNVGLPGSFGGQPKRKVHTVFLQRNRETEDWFLVTEPPLESYFKVKSKKLPPTFTFEKQKQTPL